jgi:hypothetical protein
VERAPHPRGRAYKFRAGFLHFMKEQLVSRKQHPDPSDAPDDYIERLLFKEFRSKDPAHQSVYQERAVNVAFSGPEVSTEEPGDAGSTGDAAGGSADYPHGCISFTHQLLEMEEGGEAAEAGQEAAPPQQRQRSSQGALTTREKFALMQEQRRRVARPDSPPLPWLASIDAPVLGVAHLLSLSPLP